MLRDSHSGSMVCTRYAASMLGVKYFTAYYPYPAPAVPHAWFSLSLRPFPLRNPICMHLRFGPTILHWFGCVEGSVVRRRRPSLGAP